jgi:hypothetical protein
MMALWNKIELLVFGLVVALWWWRAHRRAARPDSDEPDEDEEGGLPYQVPLTVPPCLPSWAAKETRP